MLNNKNRIIFSIILGIFIYSIVLASPHLKVKILDIDSSHFPIIRGKFVVKDSGGAYIRNLTENNFRIYEDGIKVSNPIINTEIKSLNIALVIDSSGSMKYFFENVKKISYALVKIFNEFDKVEIISFDEKVKILQKFTKDRFDLINAILSVKPWGGTILYDALMRAIEETAKQVGKKAVIVITDGFDETRKGEPKLSKTNLKSIIQLSKERNVPIFVVGIGTKTNDEVLQTLAEKTKGKYYKNPHPIELVNIYRQIAGNWEGLYTFTYASPVYYPDGSVRKVEIEAIFNSASGIGKAFYEAPGKSNIKEVVEDYHYQYYETDDGRIFLKSKGKIKALRNR